MSTWLHRAPAAALMALLLAGPAAAQQNRVFALKDLYELCKSTEIPRQSTCNGYVAGVRHTLGIFKNTYKDRIALCIPDTVNNKDFKDGFIAWAEKNRGEFERSAVRGVIKSAFERYPCSGSPQKPFEF